MGRPMRPETDHVHNMREHGMHAGAFPINVDAAEKVKP
jgi:hypothetical protein